jgi:hypothetical protein
MKKEEKFLTSCSVVVWKDMCAMNQGERESSGCGSCVGHSLQAKNEAWKYRFERLN